ncbi:hypothetical protein PIB30_028809 [Stylosanthes scabra]|uniref:Uncharacterized protein n=1 Tax=Stylosanthes scabra TaxID=79078 RepID=A0ABU6TD03_9FABA|nr:hypothetical protein [Stylosanthes scabra]
MKDLSMFQRLRTVALEYEKPGTYGIVSTYPLYGLVECGFAERLLSEAIVVSKPKTLAEFREKAHGQIEIEEFCQARRAEKPEPNKFDNQPIKSTNNSSNNGNRDVRNPFQPTPRFKNYTQFNKDKSEIIKEILKSKLIKPPSKAWNYKDQKYVDRSKYCTFHQKHGHNTADCVIANDLLEKLARQGHLDKYISGRIAKKSTESSSNSKSKDKLIVDETPDMEGE